jgi:hypothetical protein
VYDFVWLPFEPFRRFAFGQNLAVLKPVNNLLGKGAKALLNTNNYKKSDVKPRRIEAGPSNEI